MGCCTTCCPSLRPLVVLSPFCHCKSCCDRSFIVLARILAHSQAKLKAKDKPRTCFTCSLSSESFRRLDVRAIIQTSAPILKRKRCIVGVSVLLRSDTNVIDPTVRTVPGTIRTQGTSIVRQKFGLLRNQNLKPTNPCGGAHTVEGCYFGITNDEQ